MNAKGAGVMPAPSVLLFAIKIASRDYFFFAAFLRRLVAFFAPFFAARLPRLAAFFAFFLVAMEPP